MVWVVLWVMLWVVFWVMLCVSNVVSSVVSNVVSKLFKVVSNVVKLWVMLSNVVTCVVCSLESSIFVVPWDVTWLHRRTTDSRVDAYVRSCLRQWKFRTIGRGVPVLFVCLYCFRVCGVVSFQVVVVLSVVSKVPFFSSVGTLHGCIEGLSRVDGWLRTSVSGRRHFSVVCVSGFVVFKVIELCRL